MDSSESSDDLSKPRRAPAAHNPFRYRKRTLGVLLIYIPLLVVPWVLTCVLSIRPITQPDYLNQQGQYSPRDIQNFQTAIRATRVLTSIAAVLTVPVISAMLAHAAVVYTQRRKVEQTLQVGQTFALADRTWQNAVKMLGLACASARSHRNGSGSWLLWLGAVTLLISALQQPLQQLLVSTKPISLVTCMDLPEPSKNTDPTCHALIPSIAIIGRDPEPADMAVMPRNVVAQKVLLEILSVSDEEPQANFWPEGATTALNSSETLNSIGSIISSMAASQIDPVADPAVRGFFVTNLPNGTTTGILRQHAIRLNTTITCDHIDSSQIPRPCPGSNPFQTDLTLPPFLAVSVCAPGAVDRSPWNLTRDRKDITEDLYIELNITQINGNPLAIDEIFTDTNNPNISIHCFADTSRGYFELGNVHNNYTPGPLLNSWPNQSDLTINFNDQRGGFREGLPSASDINPSNLNDSLGVSEMALNPNSFLRPNESEPPTPGPLLTTALATFGNNTFFQAVKTNLTNSSAHTMRQICQPGAFPFARLQPPDVRHDIVPLCAGLDIFSQADPDIAQKEGEEDLLQLIYKFVAHFNDTSWAREALYAGTFLANRAILTQTAAEATHDYLARPISISDGTTITIPSVSASAIVGLSALVALQVAILIGFAIYIYSVPTWTSELDAWAIAKLACNQEPGAFGSFHSRKERTLEEKSRLVAVNGVVGVDTYGPSGLTHDVQLTFGGPGVISRSLAAR